MDVLVAENDVSALSHIAELIQRLGHNVEKAGTAQVTLDIARENAFDLLFLDMSLPDMKAQELIEKLKELLPDIRIVTMTAVSTDELEKEIRTLGIVYYMSKPVSENILKDILDHISTIKKNGKVYLTSDHP
ncbi:MAG: hypothetical protein B1H12_01745 [Desulfobacteraceae bacterium 4484_190.2]|nr:MAG: hypothetical protein B1H12_01745 [Desulfobacteraceae bacterium 4484_190.2]